MGAFPFQANDLQEEKMGGMQQILNFGDPLYPAAITEERMPQKPQLYVNGDPSVFERPCLSVIGARRASPYGLAIAEMAGRIAAESGIVLVSGGAMGCDRAASRAALDAGGTTIIVSGCGADRVYPDSSADIFKDALSSGGAVVSLETWGMPPLKHNFPKRNVVIAALSPVLLVAEAGLRSGTMTTADAAISMDKTIYAAPGPIFSPNSQGTNRLIADGALPICCESDLETRISLDYNVLRLSSESVPHAVGEVISTLITGPLRPDELAAHLGQSVLTLLRTLSDYEAQGIVERMADGRYSLSARAYHEYRGAFVPKEAHT